MSWIDQGRQEHGYFGNGTGPGSEPDESLKQSAELRSRVFAAVATAAEALRARDPRLAQSLRASTDTLKILAPIWALAAELKPNQFRQAFFGQDMEPVEAWHVQQPAAALERADTRRGIMDAGHDLADAAAGIGPDRWPGFMQQSARSLVALDGAIQKVTATTPRSAPVNIAPQATPAARSRYLGLDSIFIPGSPTNERFATETERLFRSMGDAIADAVSGLSGSVVESRVPGQPTEKDGYVPPKSWDGKQVRAPNGRGYKYPDNKGKVWVPSGEDPHGHRPHWDVQGKGKNDYDNIYPGGEKR